MTVLELNVTAKFRNVQSWRRNKMKQSFFLIIHTYNIKYLLLIVLSLKINKHILRYLTKTANKLVYTLPLPTRQPCFFFWIISGGIFSSGILTHFHLVKWGHRRRRSLCTSCEQIDNQYMYIKDWQFNNFFIWFCTCMLSNHNVIYTYTIYVRMYSEYPGIVLKLERLDINW